MRGFPHSVVLQQISADQPRIWVWFLLLFVPNWLPQLLNQGLMLWPSFTRAVADHHASYFLIFFGVQMSLICGAILFLTRNYASALWSPPAPSGSHSFKSLVILVPLLLFHLSNWLLIFPLIMVPPSIPKSNELSQTLASMHDEIWGRLAYGASLTGVVCESISSFVAPVLEEMLFSGLLANRLAKSFGLTVAVLGAPVCFALVHVVQFGIGPHLIPLFLAGLTYTVIRFYSGSLRMAGVQPLGNKSRYLCSQMGCCRDALWASIKERLGNIAPWTRARSQTKTFPMDFSFGKTRLVSQCLLSDGARPEQPPEFPPGDFLTAKQAKYANKPDASAASFGVRVFRLFRGYQHFSGGDWGRFQGLDKN